MTTYILAGGNDLGSEAYGNGLSQFVHTQLERSDLVILSCFFARTDDEKQKALPYWDKWFASYFPEAEIIDADQDDFYEQLARADVLYLHGGRGNGLFDTLHDREKLERAVAGKIVIGSSAGAHYLASASYHLIKKQITEGMGIVPLPVLVHYGITEWRGDEFEPDFWQAALRKLQHHSSQQVVLCLPEGEFAVFQK